LMLRKAGLAEKRVVYIQNWRAKVMEMVPREDNS